VFERCAVGDCRNDVFESSVKGKGIVEWLKKNTICKFSRMGSNIINADHKSPQTAVQHQHNIGSVGSGFIVGGVEELGRMSDPVSDGFIAKLSSAERHLAPVVSNYVLRKCEGLVEGGQDKERGESRVSTRE
jgi:hypothetical protein